MSSSLYNRPTLLRAERCIKLAQKVLRSAELTQAVEDLAVMLMGCPVRNTPPVVPPPTLPELRKRWAQRRPLFEGKRLPTLAALERLV